MTRAVAGCSAWLIKYARDRRVRRITPYESQQYAQALAELAEFMEVDGLGSVSNLIAFSTSPMRSVKSRKKLLRNYGTVECLMQVLRTPFKLYNNNAKDEWFIEFKDFEEPQNRNTKLVGQ